MPNVRREVRVIFWAVTLLFLLFLTLPLAILLYRSFWGDGGLTLSSYIGILSDGSFRGALQNSFSVSAFSAVISVLLAFFLAYTVHFTNLPAPLRRAISGLTVLPMLLPTITYGFAILYSFGKQGLITRLFGRQLFDLYGFSGLTIGYVIYTLPISFLLISNTLRYVDKRFLVVSRLMGDSALRTLFITAVRPVLGSLGAALVQSFFLAFTDFGIPASVGGEYDVVATHLYNTMLGAIPSFSDGAAIAMLMMLPSIASIALLRFLERYNFRYNRISEAELRRSPARDAVCGLGSGAVLLMLLSVFLVIFFVPFVKMWPYEPSFTLEHMQAVFSTPALARVYINALLVAGLTALLGTLTAYAAALVTTRTNLSARGKGALDAIALVINTIPGMVLGIAFLLTFAGTPLHNTFAILVICNIVHFFSTPYLMMKNSLSKLSASWETTAMLMGDSWLQTILRVVTPNTKATIWEAASYFFVNAMVTVSAVIFLAGARTMVITTKIKELQYQAKFDQIFALSLLILATNLLVKAAVMLLTRTKKEKNT